MPDDGSAPGRSAPSDDQLLQTLRAHGWRVGPAARALGISRTWLYELIERSGHLRKAADIGSKELADAVAGHDGDVESLAGELRVSPHGLKLRLRELGLGPAGPPVRSAPTGPRPRQG